MSSLVRFLKSYKGPNATSRPRSAPARRTCRSTLLAVEVNLPTVQSIDDFELRIAELDRRLRPIADRPVDITKPGWGVRLVQGPHPLDEAGVRLEAELLLREVIKFYQASSEECRQAIRKLFEENRAWAWAASLRLNPTNEENFREHLLLFSIQDQGRDS